MKKNIKLLLFYYLPPIALCLFIFIQSSYPSVVEANPFPGFDKFLHFSAYGLLGLLFFRLFHRTLNRNLKQILLISIIITTLYGISDEIHQSFIPARSADIYDILADFMGSVVGATIYMKGVIYLFVKTKKAG